jgi:peptidoglycan hydrolase-like protein with peptidoglycan-binding domain
VYFKTQLILNEKVIRAENSSANYALPLQKRPLIIGDPIVFEAQTLLVRWGYKIAIDGQYGKITKNPIADFQKIMA